MTKMLKRKNVNLYSAYYRKPAPDKFAIKKRILYGIPGGVAALLLVICGVVYCALIYKNFKINEINDYLSDEGVKSSYEQAAAVAADKKGYEGEISKFSLIKEDQDSYPQFSSDDLTRIYAAAPAGTIVKGLSYDSGSGILKLSVEAPKYDYAGQTVANLRNTGIFSEVRYQGYEVGNSGIYYFDAFCFVEGGEAR